MQSSDPTPPSWLPGAVIGAVVLVHLVASPSPEPFKNNDETRHVMTGVFVRDALHDLPQSATNPKQYAVRYYLQYPALGLLIWPPFFYLVEGAAMAVFGTSYVTARVLVALFAIVAGIYAYRLALRTHGPRVAAFALAFFGFAPLVFDLSRYVLLEVPTLALVLASVFHFERYLGESRARDALLACLLAALAALTRFDGVVLLPYFVLRLAFTWQFRLLARRPVIVGVALAFLLTGPYYLFTWMEYRTGLEAAAGSGTATHSTGFLDARNFVRYPAYIPEQVGWAATTAAAVGLVVSLGKDRSKLGPHLTLMAAVYVMFVPLAEPEPRHAVYWVSAVALFAALGVVAVADRFGKWVALGVGAIVLLGTAYEGTAYEATDHRGWWVRGYQDAAEYVVAHRTTDRPVLMDGVLNGGFIYQVRRADPDRRVVVLRGDKLLYAVLSDPHAGYQEFAKTDAEVLELLHKYDPEFIVVEQPQLFFDLKAANQLRDVLAAHPHRFELKHTVPIESNRPRFRDARLEVYRKVDRNPNPTPAQELPVLGLGRSVGTAD